MKKYTITFDEKQMEFIKVAMDSQVEVCTDVVRDAYKSHAEDTWDIDKGAEYAHASMDFYMAVAIREILNSATREEDENLCRKRKTIPSKEYALEISDFIDGELYHCLRNVVEHLYTSGYMDMVSKEEIYDTACEMRDSVVGWLEGSHNLVGSDGTDF